MQTSPASRGQIFSWTLFDFANTGFYVIVISLVFQKYFVGTIAGGNEAYWGRAISASMLITALIGPLLGSIADATNRKKVLLGVFTAACVAATVGMYFTGPGTLGFAILLLIVANVGFEGGTVFYDAFLPEITTPENYAKLSGYGFAMGYLGSIVTLAIVIALDPGADPSGDTTRLTFLVAATFFAIFSLPLFFKVREHQRERAEAKGLALVAEGYRRVRETLTHIRRYDAVKKFLIAFFVYNDSILTVILFATTFATELLRMSEMELGIFFLIVQISALGGSVLFGAITNRIGARQAIVITLIIWIGVAIGAYFVGPDSKYMFFVIGAVAGIGLGSAQSTSRAYMALVTPWEKRTEFFGFYDGFFGKASAVVGPLVFGEISVLLGQRPAVLMIGGMFVLGIILVLRTPDVRVGEGAGAEGSAGMLAADGAGRNE